MTSLPEQVRERMQDRTWNVADAFNADFEDGHPLGQTIQWGLTAVALAAGAVWLWNFKTPLPFTPQLQEFSAVSHEFTPNQAFLATDGLFSLLGAGIGIGLAWPSAILEGRDDKMGPFGCLMLAGFTPLGLHVSAASLPAYGARKLIQGAAIGVTKTINGIEGAFKLASTNKQNKRR